MILLASALDYAGLFPPAGLGMAEAVRNYAAYRRSPERVLLGRFVVPAARLDELEAAVRELPGRPDGTAWELSVLGGGDPRAERERLTDFMAGPRPMIVRSLERKVESADEVDDVVAAQRRGGQGPWKLYLEVPTGATALIDAISSAGAYAKVRTGGTTVDAFPAPDALARFVLACSSRGVSFKATAGLHHAVRASHHVTYEPTSPCATMHGFLNLFVGAALLDAGTISEAELVAVLEESAPDAFHVGAGARGGACWRDRVASADQVRRARTRLLHAIGTCSFTEPVAELTAMGALA